MENLEGIEMAGDIIMPMTVFFALVYVALAVANGRHLFRTDKF